MKELIKRMIFGWRLKRAVREANKLSGMFRCKYYVLLIDGKPRAVPKRNVLRMIRRKIFKKGVTIQMIEEKALYVSSPQLG